LKPELLLQGELKGKLLLPRLLYHDLILRHGSHPRLRGGAGSQ
jgi:hypothetical protein